MYLTHLLVQNIRSLRKVEVKFKAPYEGWHVFIGDNGVGKSSIIRTIALGLIGPDAARALHLNPNEWLTYGEESGYLELTVKSDSKLDRQVRGPNPKRSIQAHLSFLRDPLKGVQLERKHTENLPPENYFWGKGEGWFSASYGPFRRFTGGSPEWERLFVSDPRAAAHLSGFREDVALSETLRWLKDLEFERLKQRENDEAGNYTLLDNIRQFINNSGLLPHGATLEQVDGNGPVFRDGAGNNIPIVELSDGFRSVLSLLLELLRQFIRVYGEELVFKAGNDTITLPGIVLIDEVDAHLHPSWQTRIGQWFTTHFPKTQFIVTTHSPLVCRAAEKGTIWRLPAPNSNEPAHEITGADRERLIYGDVLDAYSTELFGHAVDQSTHALQMKQNLATLGLKQSLGELTETEVQQLDELSKRFNTMITLNPVRETVDF